MKPVFFAAVVITALVSLFASAEPRAQADLPVWAQREATARIPVIVELADVDAGDGYALAQAVDVMQDVVVQRMGISPERRFSSSRAFAATVSKAELVALQASPYVHAVRQDLEVRSFLSSSVPQANGNDLWLIQHNNSNLTGAGQTVCVLDTGIDYNHTNLGGFLGAKVLSGYDFINNDDDPLDDNGHGTHVAGIIASNHSVTRGVAPEANLVSIKVLNSGGGGPLSAVVSGIEWCTNNATRFNITVISMSLGTSALYTSYCDGVESTLTNAVNDAIAKNITVVAATGNDGSTTGISLPGCVENVTSVGAVDGADALVYNRNNITDILAPGVTVTSTKKGGGTEALSGTSMATPHVSGAVALLQQFMKLTENRSMLPSNLTTTMNVTGVGITDSGGSGLVLKRLDVLAALASIESIPPNATFVDGTPGNNTRLNGSFFSVNLTANNPLFGAFFEWNLSVNYTMNGAGVSWWLVNVTNLTNGNNTYRVFLNSSTGETGITGARNLFVNNTAPVISSSFPALNISIAEPSNQTFNVTAADTDSDALTFTWYQDGVNSSTAFNFSFAGNYTSNATYNITLVISDGSLSARRQWNFTVNNTNRIPVWNQTPGNVTLPEDVNFTLLLNGSDSDGDALTYYVNNTANFSLDGSTGTLHYNATPDFFGTWWLNVSAGDAEGNVSAIVFFNVTSVNDLPQVNHSGNLSVNASLWANFSVNATDVESVNMSFVVNDSAVALSSVNRSVNASWLTTVNDSGVRQLVLNVSDGANVTRLFLNVSVIALSDFDADGVPDIYDDDDDNDGIPDDEEDVVGNFSSINTTVTGINVTVNGTANLSRRFNSTVTINVSNGTHAFVEFPWNFTNASLYLNFTVRTQPSGATNGSLLIRGLRLQENVTKNVSFDRVNGTNSICIKDADIEDITNISFSCNAANETFLACPGASGLYNCSLTENSTRYRVSGLRFSGVREQCPDNDADGHYDNSCAGGTDCDDNDAGKTTDCSAPVSSSSSGSGGGGGGGGGGLVSPAGSGVARFFSLLAAGVRTDASMSEQGIAVTSVSFVPQEQLSSATLRVEAVNASGVPLLLNGTYQYLKITLDKGKAGNVRIGFSVNASWLAANDFAASTVTLHRFVSSRWFALDTAQLNQSAGTYGYEAQSPGLSFFAITAASRSLPSPPVNITSPSNVTNLTIPPPFSLPETETLPERLDPLMLLVASIPALVLLLAAALWKRRKQ